MKKLKLFWRFLLSLEENKATFFHANKKLISNKKYNFLYRKGYNNIETLYYNSEKDELYLKTKENISVVTNTDYGIFIEIFIDKIYSLPVYFYDKDFCVFDVGMNRGYASLFFANMEKCKHVYGFEIDVETFRWAQKNFELNKQLQSKISSYNYGFWDETKEIEILSSEKDGVTSVNIIATEFDEVKKLQQGKTNTLKKAYVKEASSVIDDFTKNVSNEKLILKIDIEGAEYKVLENLYTKGKLSVFDLIIGECHNGISHLEVYLNDFICLSKCEQTDKRIEFCYINKRIEL